MTHTVYIAGKMRGLPNYNFPAFHAAAKLIRKAGYFVIDPSRNLAGKAGLPIEKYMEHCLPQVARCDLVFLLPGFENSEGVTLELQVAKVCGKKVYTYHPDETESFGFTVRAYTAKETVCQEADRLVVSDRQQTYGHPIDDFTRTGKMWAAILGLEEVTAEQVALCMVALKLSRECHQHKRDNLVDGCGYLKTIALIKEKRESL